MKKQGFTLAEVLITLTVIGVIAAVTLPSLITDTTSAQIGPKLAKAVSAFEQANTTLLSERSVDSLTDANVLTDAATYFNSLDDYLKFSRLDDAFEILSKDGMIYRFEYIGQPGNTAAPAYMQRIGNVWIDINGESAPNRSATDQFAFSWWNDGSLRPWGATNWNGGADAECVEENEDNCSEVGAQFGATDRRGGTDHWTVQCPVDEAPVDSDFCAGHIFENNLRVLYR
jgi:prepilin-type N-terminal cleavage/methylation domain-containing protein